MFSPALALSRETFVIHDEFETTVDLVGRYAASRIQDIDLDEGNRPLA